MDCSTPGFSVHHQLPEIAQTHMHWVGDLILCHPLLLLPSSPAAGSFLTSQFFTSGGQRIAASALVLPVNIQDWFPLGLTGWISLQYKGLSRVFSNTTVQKHQSWTLNFLYGPTLTFIHDYWKNKEICYKRHEGIFMVTEMFEILIVVGLIQGEAFVKSHSCVY